MTALIRTSLRPEEAIARGDEVFEVLIRHWGTNVLDRYPPQVGGNQAGFPGTPAAIAIGPMSTVDRAWVSWNTQQKISAEMEIPAPEFMARFVSAQRPLMFAQPAGRGVYEVDPTAGQVRQAMQAGLLYVFPSFEYETEPTGIVGRDFASTIVPESYLKADGTTAAFPDVTDNAIFWAQSPTLQLQYIMKHNVLPPSTHRFPYQFRFKNNGGPTVEAEEVGVGYLPTFGRKTINIGISGSQAGMTFRVAALRGLTPLDGVANEWWVQETTEGLHVATNADEVVKFQLCDVAADYTIIYATSPGGAALVRYTLTAYD